MHTHTSEQDENTQDEITEYDFDKLRSTIKQFVRDWSIEVRHGMLKINIGCFIISLNPTLYANSLCT